MKIRYCNLLKLSPARSFCIVINIRLSQGIPPIIYITGTLKHIINIFNVSGMTRLNEPPTRQANTLLLNCLPVMCRWKSLQNFFKFFTSFLLRLLRGYHKVRVQVVRY